MRRIEVRLDHEVPLHALDAVAEKLHYCDERLREVAIRGDRRDCVVGTLDDGASSEQVERKVRAMVGELLQGIEPIERVISFDTRPDVHPRCRADVLEELERSGEVIPMGVGQFGFAGRFLRLMSYLDGELLKVAAAFGAEPQEYPTLIPTAILKRAGYYGSFPQFATLACCFREDVEALKAFVARLDAHGEDITVDLAADLAIPAHQLNPAVCYHCFPQLEGAELGRDTGRVVTARSHCFRFESGNLQSLERLWNFTMREIVFAGSVDFVRRRRSEAMEMVQALVRRLGLAAWLENAADPFFFGDFGSKTAAQLKMGLKFELRLLLPFCGRSVAAGSFNYHGQSFGKAFDIRLAGGRHAATGCAAFGLERWVYAFLCQWGLDAAAYPEEVRVYLGSGTR